MRRPMRIYQPRSVLREPTTNETHWDRDKTDPSTTSSLHPRGVFRGLRTIETHWEGDEKRGKDPPAYRCLEGDSNQ